MDEAIRLLEPIAAETGDAGLARLLSDARAQQVEASRRLQALLGRVKGLRDRGQLDEAIQQLESTPAANAKGTLLNAMLAELRNENVRKQALVSAISAASQALEKLDFHGGMEALQSVRRAYGDTEEISRVIADYEARRTSIANEHVGKSIEAARAALLAKDAPAALKELQGTAELVEFADPGQQADWNRLSTEAGKPPMRRTTGSVGVVGAGAGVEEVPPQRRKIPIWAFAAAGCVVLLIVGFILWPKKQPPPPPPPAPESYIQVAKAPPGAAIRIDNGAPVQADASGQASVKVTPGPHHLVVSKDGFAPFTDDVNVAQGETYKDNVSLVALPPPEKTGTLTAKGNVQDVKVFVDGVSRGVVRQGKSIPIEEGPHKIRYSAQGYVDSDEKTVNITRGKDLSDRFNLVKTAPPPPPPPGGASILSFSANPSSIQQGSQEQATLQWTTKDAVFASIDSGVGNVNPNSQVTVKPSSTTIYTLTAKGKDGQTRTQTAVVTVTTPKRVDPPSISSFSATPAKIEKGQSITLQWTTADADQVTIDHGIDVVALNGHTPPISPQTTTTYTLIAKGPGGVQQATTTVTVTKTPPAPPPPPDDKALLKKVLSEFQAALNSRDTGRIKAVWVGMDAGQTKTLQGFFNQNPEGKLTEECPESALSLEGDRAQWACTAITTIKVSGKMTPFPKKEVLTFAKKGDNWYLAGKK